MPSNAARGELRDASRSERWAIRALACLALLARLVLVLRGGGHPTFWDERDYDAIARSLVSGHGFANAFGPTAFRPPAQPLFLAAIYRVVGARPIVVEIVQAILLATLPFAVARLARLVTSRPRAAIVAAALAALHPGLAYASATLYPVALTTVALTWGLLFCAEALQGGSAARLFAGVALLAIATAATPYFLPLPIVVAILARKRRVVALLVLVVGLAPTAAWSLRNARAVGTFSPNTAADYNLALGANDEATPRSGNWIEPVRPPGDEVARARAYRERAHRWIAENPGRFLYLSTARAILVFDSVGKPSTRGAHDGLLAKLIGFAMLPFTLLALVELVRSRRTNVAILTAAAVACVVLAAAPTIVKPRFRFPCDPSLSVFAAAALARRLGARGEEPSCAP